MISKDMYMLLSEIPKAPNTIKGSEIMSKLLMADIMMPSRADVLLEVAIDNDFVSATSRCPWMGEYGLLEEGLIEIEEYERATKRKRHNAPSEEKVITEPEATQITYVVSEKTDNTSKYVMWATIASAIAAIIALFK
ncbi:MAG: hypothetical protein IKU32_00595 [Clostridia bacterium]|nr:hypothetical protein [Clostridia bacterium]